MKLHENLPQIVLLLVLAIVVLLVVQPYLAIIAFSALVAYLTYPVYVKLSQQVTSRGAAVLITSIALALTCFVVYYGILMILNEITRAYIFFSDLPMDTLSPMVADALRQGINSSIVSLSGLLYSLPKYALSALIFFISLFYFLIDGKGIFQHAISLIPLSEEKRKAIAQSIHRHIDAFVHVQLMIGVTQGIVAGIGFSIFHLPYPLIAALAGGILSILPVLGPYLLYFPVGLYILLRGAPITGLGIILYGLVIGSFLDYVARPYLIGKRAQVHPLIIFVGVLGGIRLLGVIGIFVGPTLLSVAILILRELYSELSRA